MSQLRSSHGNFKRGMCMECFHIDESGYTGFDLLNPEQRFQGATAVDISDDEATRLIQEYFPKLQASELKYHALARRPGYRKPLMDLQRALLSQHKCVPFSWRVFQLALIAANRQ